MGGSCGMVSGGAVSNGMVGDSGEARVASWWPGGGPAILLTSAASAMILVHLFAAVSAYDDAYITFRYVRNFVGGRGAVFNAGERIFGISTPLYAAWLTLLHSAFGSIDLAVLAVRSNCLFLGAAGVLACALLLKLGCGRWWAAIAGSVVMLSDGILRASIGGMESSMFLALGFGSMLAVQVRRDTLAILLASLTTLVRPEGVLLLALVVLARLSDPATRSLPVRLWLAGLPLALWTLGATLYYGTPVPHSIIAKSRPLYPLPAGAAVRNLARHAGEWILDGAGLLWRAAAGVAAQAPPWEEGGSQVGLIVVGGLATAYCFWGWPRPSAPSAGQWGRWLVLPGFLVGLLLLYGVTNPYLLPWYFPLAHAPWLLLVIAAASSASNIRALPHAGRVLIGAMAALTALELFASHLAPSDWSLLSRGASTAKQSAVLEGYRRTAEWITLHSEPGETVAAPEIGMLGYHLDRRITDSCGLVSPEALPYLPVPLEQRGSQQGVISVDFVRATSPDLVVTLVTFARPSLLRSDWFGAEYELVHDEAVGSAAAAPGDAGHGVMVFRRKSRTDGAGDVGGS